MSTDQTHRLWRQAGLHVPQRRPDDVWHRPGRPLPPRFMYPARNMTSARARCSSATNRQDHSEYEWLPYEAALARVYYRGLKDGLRSTQGYIVGVDNPAPELRLR